MKNSEQYLYHYTSIDILTLILKNRTIRLNPLDRMDDLQEQKTSDLKNAGRFIFASAWTEEEKELIPMWKMYTNPDCGVRIRLKKNPFKRQGTTKEKYIKVCKRTGINEDSIKFENDEIDTFMDVAELIEKGVIYPDAFNGNLLTKVEYTDDLELLEPQLIRQNGDNIQVALGELGKFKNTFWSFQKEWRYKMMILNLPKYSGPDKLEEESYRMFSRIISGNEPRPLSYIDLEICTDAFEEMEIVPSPQMKFGYRQILNDLVEKYNPTAKIVESKLKGLI